MRRMLMVMALAGLTCLFARAGQTDLTEAFRIEVPANVEVRFLMVSPDGRQLAAACADRKIRVWSLPPGKGAAPVRTLDVLGEPVSSVVYSYDGAWMAAGTVKGTIAVFRTDTGKMVQRFQTTAQAAARSVQALALSPDGARLAVARAGVPAELWDVADGKRRATLTTRFGGSMALDFSPDGTRLATADEDTMVRLYDADGRLRGTAEDLLLETFTLMFTPDGKQVAVAGADKTVTLLDGSTAKIVRQLPRQQDPIIWLAALRKSETIVTGSFKEESMAIAGETLAWDQGGAAPRVLVSGRLFNGGGVGVDGRLLLTSMDARTIMVWAVR